MNQGYVKIHRKLLNNPVVMKDIDHLAVWIYLLLNATHKEVSAMFRGEKIILKPGQLITGSKSIADKLGINYVKVHRIISEFKSENQIEKQTSNKNSLITIVNWEMYQDNEKQNETQMKYNCNTTENKQECKECNNIYSTTSIMNERESLFEFVERVFGRTLNPIENEHIASWKDDEVTRYAIGQAVLSNALSIKYIEKILYEYKKNNILTLSQAQERDRKFREQNDYSKQKNFIDEEVLNYNWLEGTNETDDNI